MARRYYVGKTREEVAEAERLIRNDYQRNYMRKYRERKKREAETERNPDNGE